MSRRWIRFWGVRETPHPYPGQVKYMVVAIGALCVLIGCAMVWLSIADHVKARKARDWQKVSGTLTSCEAPQWARSGQLTVKYEYDFGGRKIQGERICYGVQSARKIFLKEVKTPSPIEVFVNPQLPEESVLFPGYAPGDRWASEAGAVLFFIGVFFMMRVKSVTRTMAMPPGRGTTKV